MAQKVILLELAQELNAHRDLGNRLVEGIDSGVYLGMLLKRDHNTALPERRFTIPLEWPVSEGVPEPIPIRQTQPK